MNCICRNGIERADLEPMIRRLDELKFCADESRRSFPIRTGEIAAGGC